MPAYDIAARTGSWIADVIDTQTGPGEEIGYAVTCVTWPSPQGAAVNWMLTLTLASPLPGRPDLAACATVTATVPSEEGVRRFAETSLAKLRAQFQQAKRRKAAAGNGHAERRP